MQLMPISLSKLCVSSLNMRDGRKPPDIADVLPSIRARGILVPLLVRANASADAFEIVAGRRRYFAAKAVEEESGVSVEVPCALLDAADDAEALEASLLENVAREQPHEVELWESFTRLVKEGRSPKEVALTFSLGERQVEQILALGNLLPKLRDLYRREEIDAASIRLLTMAGKSRQKEWLGLFADPNAHAPTGMRLKAWLFGGASIPTSVAIFDLQQYPGEIVTDLFGEERYFADATQFWAAQRTAVEARRQEYLDAGWADAVILEPGTYFNSWDYEKTPRKKGGKVFIAISQRGEVAFHEGFLTKAEARRKAKGEAPAEERPQRPELTAALTNYADLHRHAAVRVALLGAPAVALRLFAAHAIGGSSLISVRPDPRRAASDAVAESAETCVSETRFDEKRREALALLKLDPESPTLIQRSDFGGELTVGLFLRLLDLSDDQLLFLISLVMGEALEAGSTAVEAVGLHLGVDMSKTWVADDAFFSLIRDRELLGAMVGELAGTEAAAANASEKARALKAIIGDCLAGENGREKVHGWVPRFIRFPPSGYTKRGGVPTAGAFARIAPLIEARARSAACDEDDAVAAAVGEAEPLAA
jgi:ParB family chromosome partitioning protein